MLIIVFGRKKKMEIRWRLHRLDVKLHRNEATDESSFVTWTWVVVTHIRPFLVLFQNRNRNRTTHKNMFEILNFSVRFRSELEIYSKSHCDFVRKLTQ